MDSKGAIVLGSRQRTLGRAGRAVCALLALFGAPSLAAQDAEDSGEAESSAETHAIREGDTLWDLSGRYYGSSYEWPRLWSINPEITNPHWIYPGHMLRLREGAQGGYTTSATTIGGGEGTLTKSGFGRGFGNARGRLPTGTVLLGEQVYLDREALEQSAHIVGSAEDHFMLSPTDEVYLQFKGGEAPVAGKELSVFVRLDRKEVKPTAGNMRVYRAGHDGEVVRVLGALKVKSYDEEKRIARAVITEALDPIERGFEVTDVPRRLAQVAPKTNGRKVESTIIAATRPLGTLGQGQVVFIDAGEKQGVEVGNRFTVIRQGDTWRRDLTLDEHLSGAERPERHPLSDEDYPWEDVGEARVIYVRPESCTALITASLHELNPGDRVEMREGY